MKPFLLTNTATVLQLYNMLFVVVVFVVVVYHFCSVVCCFNDMLSTCHDMSPVTAIAMLWNGLATNNSSY